MFSAIRSRITYINVVATLVLVFAMTGGALAAKKYLITSTKQISPSVLKSLQGKSGAAGAAGAAGAQGPAGPAGPAGAKGDAGGAGKDGAQGNEGLQGKQGATGATGVKGTNGTNGATGPQGPLQPGKTETGAWALGEITSGARPIGGGRYPISFTLPLAAQLDGTHCFRKSGGFVNGSEVPGTCQVHIIRVNGKEVSLNVETFESEEFTSGQCHGTPAAPSADPGNLCVYTGELEHASINDLLIQTPAPVEPEESGASTAGAVLHFSPLETGAVGFGTWAVTAEE